MAVQQLKTPRTFSDGSPKSFRSATMKNRKVRSRPRIPAAARARVGRGKIEKTFRDRNTQYIKRSGTCARERIRSLAPGGRFCFFFCFLLFFYLYCAGFYTAFACPPVAFVYAKHYARHTPRTRIATAVAIKIPKRRVIGCIAVLFAVVLRNRTDKGRIGVTFIPEKHSVLKSFKCLFIECSEFQ